MDNIEWFFNLHDKNKDGFLSKDEVLTVSESLLVCELFLQDGTNSLTLLFSSSFGSKSVMCTWVLSAASCPTRSSTVTPSYLDPKGRKKMIAHRPK